MTIKYLGDENLPGKLLRAISRHNGGSNYPLDFITVGDPADLPLGSDDSLILQWIESHGRILVTSDKTSMPGHLANHFRLGGHVPGIFVIQPTATIPEIIDHLAAAAHASDPSDWHDHIWHFP